MKTLILLVLLLSQTIGERPNDYDCSDANSEAQDAYTYSKKAHDAESLDSLSFYAKKAMTAFDDAMAYASDCECDDANTSADDGYTYAKKAYNSETLKDGQDYAKKAMSAAEDAMTYADDCNEEWIWNKK